MTRSFILLVAIIFGIFGLGYLFFPVPLAALSGIQPTATGVTDVRATYGGFQIGFALLLIWTSIDSTRYRAGLVAIAWVAAWIGIGRIFGLIIDQAPSQFHTIGLAFEIPITLIALWFMRREK